MSDRKQSLNSVAAQGRALQEKVDNIKSWVAKAEVDMLSTHPDGSQQADEHKQMIMEERRNYREELGRTRQLLQGQLLALQEDSVVNVSSLSTPRGVSLYCG